MPYMQIAESEHLEEVVHVDHRMCMYISEVDVYIRGG